MNEKAEVDGAQIPEPYVIGVVGWHEEITDILGEITPEGVPMDIAVYANALDASRDINQHYWLRTRLAESDPTKKPVFDRVAVRFKDLPAALRQKYGVYMCPAVDVKREKK